MSKRQEELLDALEQKVKLLRQERLSGTQLLELEDANETLDDVLQEQDR